MNRFCLLITGLAPLLGATGTVTHALTIAACMWVMILLHQAFLGPLRASLSGARYWLASLLLLAALGSCLQLALRALALPLALTLGYFPALICLQCLAIDTLLPAEGRWRELLLHLSGLLLACLLLGAGRQWLDDVAGMHLAHLPSGGLLLLGALLALYNWLRPTLTRRQGKR
ncbi:NADH:quinone oxidoreductase [Pseudomonas vlassakiae]|uniref:Rnf-Nqr domain containing protein n=1 Tax=Pseudomonas TaxID=286 RepID=UPI000E335147|nr:MULTISPECIES: Rnf-Nqr domain containing protein [Pseudomonas]AXQ49431.1 NADH:quinone oxidoreductase [Stenotrophomonas rhizophila]MCU0123882.1 NADH:quinone oxidoreductase [Pseudomonas vlassakiae]